MPTMKKKLHENVVKKMITDRAALVLLLGLPFALATRAFADPTPKFAYVANSSDNTISAYTINNSTGALSAVAGSPFAAGESPGSVTVDPSGRFVFVANFTGGLYGGAVSAYTINSSTGALREVAGSPLGDEIGSISVAVDPSGVFAYVANWSESNVSAYTINRSTGTLSAVAGSPFAAGNGPISVTVDPLGRFAYVTNSADNTVSAYTINRSTGALRAVAGSPFRPATPPNR
jgi:6-phosphogluconolactonase